MAVIVDGSTIVLSGTVGDLYWDDSFDATDVIMALAEIGADQDITVRLNSSGGIATEGAAIYAALSAHNGNIVMQVEGIAASAAATIAMAGDDIVMSQGAVMMIHDPSGFTFGTADDHTQSIKALNALGDAMASIYATQAGKTSDEARADMKAELWMTPEQAVEAGYADRVATKADNDNDPDPEPTAFDFRIYQHAPKRLVAMADKNGWTKRKRPIAAEHHPKIVSRQPKEKSMSGNPAGNGPANDKTHTQADVTAAADKATASASAAVTASAAEIATICADAGVPAMTAALIKEGVTPEQAKARVDGAKEIRAAVDLARKSCPAIEANLADQFIAAGTSLAGVREQLFQKMTAAQSAEIHGQHENRTGLKTDAEQRAEASKQSRASMQRFVEKKYGKKQGA